MLDVRRGNGCHKGNETLEAWKNGTSEICSVASVRRIVVCWQLLLLCIYIYAMVTKGPMDIRGTLPPGMDVKQTNASTPHYHASAQLSLSSSVTGNSPNSFTRTCASYQRSLPRASQEGSRGSLEGGWRNSDQSGCLQDEVRRDTYRFAYRSSFFAFLETRAAPANGALKARQQYPAVTAAPSRSAFVALVL